MKCVKCRAEIPKNCMYCRVCGKEVHLVPDYNFLEDDILSYIVEEGAKETLSSNSKQSQQPAENIAGKKANKSQKRKQKTYLWTGICFVIVCAIITLFIVRAEIQKKHASSYTYQFEKGEEYEQKKEYNTALTYYYNAWGLKDEGTQAPYKIISIYLDTGRTGEAVEILKGRIDKNLHEKKAYEILIRIYEEDKDYEAIRELCEKARSSTILELFEDFLVDQPTFGKISGSYMAPFSVTITSSKKYAIYYTIDGSNPITDGQRYSNAISLPQGSTTVKAVTENEKSIYSEIVANTYHINAAPPTAPKVTPDGGTYEQSVNISIHVPADCIAYYTWDGSAPTQDSEVYSGEMEMPQGNSVLSVITYNSSGLKSTMYQVNYICMPE